MLYLVATPIGNLGDISGRALEILRTVDLIAAEDTRHSGNLLKHFEIKARLEARRTAELIEELGAGRSIALITDAGMPGVSDPGHRLLRACIERGLPYSVIPGPSAVLTALIGSGFDSSQLFFGGFLPVKSGQRERELTHAAERQETTVFFESPHRLLKTLDASTRILSDRKICVARELTKQFEEYRIGDAATLFTHYSAHPPKGEIALVIDCVSSKRCQELGLNSNRQSILRPQS